MADKSSVPVELGTEKIGKLLKQYALPAIIAQTASSLYNMVDSIFIGQGVGPLAISGLAVTFPLMNLSVAFGTLVGAGAATMLSVLLGQKNYKAANKVLGNVVTLNIIIGLLFMGVTLLFLDPILYFFGASENTLPYAKEYITIILIGNVVTYGMIANFFKGFLCLIHFSLSYLIGRNQPIIHGESVMMVEQIIAIDHEVQLIRNTEHFDFAFPCRGIIGKIFVHYKITNSKTEGVGQLINFILNIEFGLSIANSA